MGYLPGSLPRSYHKLLFQLYTFVLKLQGLRQSNRGGLLQSACRARGVPNSSEIRVLILIAVTVQENALPVWDPRKRPESVSGGQVYRHHLLRLELNADDLVWSGPSVPPRFCCHGPL